MDSAYFSAFAALAGSAIGGFTSLAGSWLNHRVQFRAEQVARDRSLREDLYRAFVEEASRRYADAYEHESAKVSDLVNLYALVSRMRVLSSTAIVEAADHVVRRIIEQYRAPNRTLADVEEVLDNDALNPLRDFSNACREELARG
jgi:hypothetical protein